jgi:hypothetical protein
MSKFLTSLAIGAMLSTPAFALAGTPAKAVVADDAKPDAKKDAKKDHKGKDAKKGEKKDEGKKDGEKKEGAE